VSTLRVEHLGKHFGGISAVDDVSFEAEAGSVLGLIGPNGAGKTTVFNIITGLVPRERGRILVNDIDISDVPTHRLAALSIQRTFQNIRLWPSLSVLDNVAVGALATSRVSVRRARHVAEIVLDEVGFEGNRDGLPDALPYAFRRRVEIARALSAKPDVLLLDEPAAGMHRSERDALAELIARLKERRMALVLIEHDMALVSRTCDRVTVLDFGRVIATGTPNQVRNDARVITAYLGAE